MVGMQLGCISEIIGYIGRIMLYNNPWSFIGFMIQIGKCFFSLHTLLDLVV